MRNLSQWEISSDIHRVQALAFDLDDTLTVDSRLPSRILDALERASVAGFKIFLVTGRPAGWADALIKLLPLDGVIAENGALFFYWGKKSLSERLHQQPVRFYWTPQGFSSQFPKKESSQKSLLAKRILKKFPRARLASDQPYRLYDLAIDFAEEVCPPLSLEEASGILDEFSRAGAIAKLSSIHVNGWWGDFSKASALKVLLEKYSLSWGHLLYVGDSPNDGPLFEVAGFSVGVANIRSFDSRFDFVRPQFVCQNEAGDGALELIDFVIQAKKNSSE